MEVLIAACMLTLSMAAGNGLQTQPERYCAAMENNKFVILYQGKPLTRNVNLSDGTQLLQDGTIVKKDGSKTKLSLNQCIDSDGRISDDDQKK